MPLHTVKSVESLTLHRNSAVANCAVFVQSSLYARLQACHPRQPSNPS